MSETHRRPVSYIDKSRDYYAAHGYEKSYRWASYREVPFTGPTADLSNATVGVVTTTSQVGIALPNKVYAQAADPIPDAMFTADLAWDKDATHTNDVGTYLPLAALNRAASEGVLRADAPRFYGVPTEYSQRRTHADAEQILEWAQEDGIDVVLLVPL